MVLKRMGSVRPQAEAWWGRDGRHGGGLERGGGWVIK